jgi:type VI secretion system protein ImpH
MASEDRTPSQALSLRRALEEDCHRFDFFQAMRRLEGAHPDKPRIGYSARPVDDPVRLGQDPSLSFAPSTLSSFRIRRDGIARLAGHFFGLFGPNGPLPIHLTEYTRERTVRAPHDPTIGAFLDVFHHRMMSFFYRAWTLARPTASYDRAQGDWFGRYVASTFGIGMPSLRDRDALPDRAKLYYAGLLAGQTHHPDGLTSMLADYFRLPVAIEEFVGEWVPIPVEARCRLGGPPEVRTLSASGATAIAGVAIWSVQHRIRINLGPLRFADFERFLPARESLNRLVALVRSYLGDELAFEVRLVLKRDEVPPLKADGTARLGWTTWLPARVFTTDPDDLVMEPMAAGASAGVTPLKSEMTSELKPLTSEV